MQFELPAIGALACKPTRAECNQFLARCYRDKLKPDPDIQKPTPVPDVGGQRGDPADARTTGLRQPNT